MSGEKQNLIQVAVDETASYVKLSGRATFTLAPDFKNFVVLQLEKNKQNVFVDLKECESMDSTFVGVITSLTIKYSNDDNAHLILFNASEHLIKILKTLGLLSVLNFSNSASDDGVSFADAEKTCSSKKELSETMLEAHETLSELNEKNALEFKNVVDYLRKEVN